MKRIISLLLIFSMCMVSVLSFDPGAVKAAGDDSGQSGDVSPSVTEEDGGEYDDPEDYEDEEEDGEENDEFEEDYSVDNMLDLEYRVTAKWEGHYNVDVTLKNSSDTMIDNWEVSFDLDADIENIWNANITGHEDEEYVVKNAGWNQDIKKDGTVTFGMTVKCDGDLEFPTNCYLTRELVEVENSYSVKYKENSHWDNYVNGQIIITNESDKAIEDWKLDVTINNLEAFDNLWNAKLISKDKKGTFKFNNAEYNQNIPAGQSVEFGFIAKCSGAVEIVSSTLYEMSDDFYYEDGTYIDKDYLDEEPCIDLEDFDSYEEYLQYLEENNMKSPSVFRSRARAGKNMVTPMELVANINTYLRFYTSEGEPVQNAGKVKATQSFIFDEKGAYTIYSNKDKETKQDCYLTLGSESPEGYDIKQENHLLMQNFAHGQTFEELSVGKSKKPYFMFSGNANQYKTKKGTKLYTKWATDICFVSCKSINKKLEENPEKNPKIDYNTKNRKRITRINCANKEGKSVGNVKRVDGALSTDKSVLVIWCQMVGGGIQVSLYDMKAIRKYITGPKGTFSLASDRGKKACIASYYQKDGGDSAVRPSNSFQSIEVSNKLIKKKKTDPDQYYVYICGGNERANRELQISRFTLKKGKKGIYNKKRVKVKPVSQPNDKYDIRENNREIEGCHIIGKDLAFLITHSKTKGEEIKKDLQYLCRLKKTEINKAKKY